MKEKYSAWKKKVNAEIISAKDLEKISALTTPQEIIAVAEIPSHDFKIELLKNSLTLVLDEIKDPGNLGTIVRIADWFGIPAIICSESCADIFNPKAVQATMGSLFRTRVFYKPLEEVLKKSASLNVPVFGTVLDGENIYNAHLSSQGVIIIGSESHGISSALLPFITAKISIPSFSDSATKKADSLNAAMAAAIVCSEFRRR